MSKRFRPELINDVFEDPGLYLDFMFEKRAILFDLGDLVSTPERFCSSWPEQKCSSDASKKAP